MCIDRPMRRYSIKKQGAYKSRSFRRRNIIAGNRTWDDSSCVWACLARCGWLPAIVVTTLLLLLGATDCSTTTTYKLKKSSIRVACGELLHCAKALRTDSNNSSFTTKSCVCVSIAFLVGTVSWSVDSAKHYRPVVPRMCFGDFKGSADTFL